MLENSYRAINIALIDEWSVFAEKLDSTLRSRGDPEAPNAQKTSASGLGVGGYCLTKDIFFGEISLASFHAEASSPFKFTRLADQTNQAMPSRNLQRVEDLFDDSLQGKKVLMLGIATAPKSGIHAMRRPEVLRRRRSARMRNIHHDPFVGYWMEKGSRFPRRCRTRMGSTWSYSACCISIIAIWISSAGLVTTGR